MSRQGLILSGVVIMGLGVVVTAASYSGAQGGGHYVVAYGAMAVGLFRIVRGLATSEDPRPEERLLHRDDQAPIPRSRRSGDAQALPLIGGATCSECARKIESRLDGTACKTCNAPVHHDCSDPHQAKAHGKDAA